LISKTFASILALEIQHITNCYLNSGTKLKPLLFYPEYKKIYKEYNKNKEAQDTAPKNMHILVENYLNNLSKTTKIATINKKGTYKLPILEGIGLITTHVPCDLFTGNNIYLLESHTGILKSSSEYNSKYHSIGKNNLNHLPWHEELLYMLGDHLFIAPLHLTIRRKLYDLSIKNYWNVKTTRSKVRADIMRDSELYAYMAVFNRMYL
jgi:hypothetical protein